MTELEAWLTSLISDPARLVAFLLGVGVACCVGWRLWWRSLTRAQDELATVRGELRDAEEERDGLRRYRNETEPLLQRLYREAMPTGFRPEQLPEELSKTRRQRVETQEELARLECAMKTVKRRWAQYRNQANEQLTELRIAFEQADKKAAANGKLAEQAQQERDQAIALAGQLKEQVVSLEAKLANAPTPAAFEELRSELAAARTTIEQGLAQREKLVRTNQQLSADLRTALAKACQLEQTIEGLRSELAAARSTIAQGQTEREDLVRTKQKLSTDLRAALHRTSQLQQTIEQLQQAPEPVVPEVPPATVPNWEDAIAGAGRIWERALLEAEIPRFVPLKERRCPIIAVVNLKGGVGKTTISANLGATWWSRSANTLLLDLDFQASLTARCLGPEAWEDDNSPNQVQRYLESEGAGARELLSIARPLKWNPSGLMRQLFEGHIVTASEQLADAETSLMIRWLLRQTRDDLRFRLRRALHDPAIREKFGYVVIDCPPRLTTACINALAACDYVLIPVLPDAVSLERVHMFLTWLERFRDSGVCRGVRGIGVVVNKFRGIGPQKETVSRIHASWEGKWPGKLKLLNTRIKDDPAQAVEAAERHWPGVLRNILKYESLREAFSGLAEEIEQALKEGKL